MERFSFNLLSMASTTEAFKILDEFSVAHDCYEAKAEAHSEWLKANHHQDVENYLTAKGLVKINPLNHDLGYKYIRPSDGVEEAFQIHYCDVNDKDHDHTKVDAVVLLSEHPDLKKIIEDFRQVLANARAEAETALDDLQAMHTKGWSIVNAELDKLGLISKNEDGSYPALEKNGRMVILSEKNDEDFKELGESLVASLANMIKVKEKN